MKFIFFFFFFFFLLLSLFPLPSTQANDTTLPGSVDRTTNPQLLATLPPGNPLASEPFLSSPSGKYTAYFLRHGPVPDAGSFDNDFCYIQVAEINTTDSRWVSDCVPVSISNPCSLIFSDSGLEILNGSNSAWSTDARSENPPQNLELDDEGEMRLTGDDGELAWKASDEPRQSQHCEEPGLPGLAAAPPPFAQSIGKGSETSLGQPPSGRLMGRVGPMPEDGNGAAAIGYGGQPLVDSTPYDSGSLKPLEGWVGMAGGLLLCLTAFGGVLF